MNEEAAQLLRVPAACGREHIEIYYAYHSMSHCLCHPPACAYGPTKFGAQKGSKLERDSEKISSSMSRCSVTPQCESALQKLWHHVKNTFFFFLC